MSDAGSHTSATTRTKLKNFGKNLSRKWHDKHKHSDQSSDVATSSRVAISEIGAGSTASSVLPAADAISKLEPLAIPSLPTKSADDGTLPPISELWNEAWEALRKKNSSLVTKYEEKLEAAVSQSPKAQTVKSALSIVNAGPVEFRVLKNDQKAQVLKAMIEQRTDEMEKDEWKVKFGDNQLAVKDFIKPVVGIIKWGKDFIGEAAAVSPYSSLAWAGVSLLLPLLLEPGLQEASRTKGLEWIAALLRQCTLRESLYNDQYDKHPERKVSHILEHRQYREQLKGLYVSVLTFQATCSLFLAQSSVPRYAKDIAKWHDWEDLLKDITTTNENMTAMDRQWHKFELYERWTSEWDLKQRWHDNIVARLDPLGIELTRIQEAIKTAQDDKSRQALLKWLFDENVESISKRYDYIRNDMRNSSKNRESQSTGHWLLENSLYKKWKTSQAESFVWLHGKAGSGKSYLSCTVIDDVHKLCDKHPYMVYAYYYFTFDQPSQGIGTMLRALIRQLCGSRPDTPEWLKELATTVQNKGHDLGIDRLEDVLWKATSGFDAVYLIVDSLDESALTPPKREPILKSFARLLESCPRNVHVLATSREYTDITDNLDEMLEKEVSDEIDLQKEAAQIKGDMLHFLEHRLQTRDFRHLSSDTKDLACELLLEKANGMFQYVALQLSVIQHSYSDDISRILENLPEDLNKSYSRMFDAIEPKLTEVARRILVWVACSERPLECKEVAEAAAVDLRRREGAFDLSMRLPRLKEFRGLQKLLPGFLIEVPAWKGPEIRFSHFSIQEFLFSDEASQLAAAKRYRVEKDDGHLLIAESCLHYHIYACQADDITEYNYSQRFPLWRYAAGFWMHHMNVVEESEWSPSVKTLASSVLKPKCRALQRMVQIRYRNERSDFDRQRNDAEPGKERQWHPTPEVLTTPAYYISLSGYHRLLSWRARSFSNEQLAEDLNTASEERYDRPLQAASQHGDLRMAQLLLEYGASVDAQGGKYGNALQAAASRGSEEIVKLLIEHKVNINAQGGKYSNALQAAASRGSEEIVKLLIEHKANINAQGGFYGNAIQAAAYRGSEEILKLLIEHKADINAQGGEYGNAIQAAASGGSEEIVKLLIEHKANINAQGGFYGNAIQAAAYRGPEEIVKLLIEHKADINAQGGFYGNALQAAACSLNNSEEIIELLIECGAAINARGGYYGSALRAARMMGKEEVEKVLQAHSALDFDSDTELEDDESEGEELEGDELEGEENDGLEMERQ